MAKDRDLKKRLAVVAPALLEKDDWLQPLLFMDPGELAGRLAKELFQVGELALGAIQSGHIRAAVNWISLGLYCDQTATRASLGDAGTFRASKYQYRTNYLFETLSGVNRAAPELSVTPEILGYLDSVAALAKLAPAVGDIDRSVRTFLKRNSQVCLKSILVRIDSLFMVRHQGDHIGSTEAISTYPVEELAEGASYLVHCIEEEIGVKGTHFRNIPEAKIAKGVFDKLIIKACKIRRYAEAEILIDAFEYRCTKSGRDTIIRAPFPEFEKSIRLGYIQNQQAHDQSRLMRDLAIRKGAVSIYAVADQFFDRLHETVVKRVENPVTRYTFQLPNVPPIRNMFSTDEITVEEDIYLREVGNFELVSQEEVKNFKFCNGLTLLDLSKVHRLFMFLSRLAMRQLAPMLEDEPVLAFRSLVPIFKEDVLKGLLEWCVKPKQVEPILEFLSHRSGMGGVYDMQYRPLVYADKHYMVPLHIAGMTNWYRNVAFAMSPGAKITGSSTALTPMPLSAPWPSAFERKIASTLQPAMRQFLINSDSKSMSFAALGIICSSLSASTQCYRVMPMSSGHRISTCGPVRANWTLSKTFYLILNFSKSSIAVWAGSVGRRRKS